MKTCLRCECNKEYSNFHKDKAAKDGYCSWCIECRREYSANNKARSNELKRIKYRKDPSKMERNRKKYDDKIKSTEVPIVYKIEFNNEIIYIGQTLNIKRRMRQHKYCLINGKENPLYNFLRENNVNDIELIVIKQFESNIDSKRYEMMLILERYFRGDRMYQGIPVHFRLGY